VKELGAKIRFAETRKAEIGVGAERWEVAPYAA